MLSLSSPRLALSLLAILLMACTPPPIETPDTGRVETGPAWLPPADVGAEELGSPVVDDGLPNDADALFSDELIHVMRLELERDPWQDLSSDPREYVEATLIHEGNQYVVGMRLKGSSTYRDLRDKPSIKIRMDYRYPGQDLYGVEKFNLHNLVYDAPMIYENLGYRIFRAAGYPAARTGYVRLEVNGDDYGLYSIVEPHSDQFLEASFPDGHGNLYENRENYCELDDCNCFEAEEFDEGNHDALEALCDAVEVSGPAWLEAMKGQLDWDQYINFLALEMSIVHWDSYSYDLSNYRVYHEPSADRWTFLVASLDLVFGWRPWSYPDCNKYAMNLDNYTMGIISKRCRQDASCEAELFDRILEISDIIEGMDPGPMVDAALDRVRAQAETDPRKEYGMSKFEEHGACVRDFLVGRPEVLREYVEGERAR